MRFGIPVWKTLPLLRILLPLVAGIILYFYWGIDKWLLISGFILGCLLQLIPVVLPVAKWYRAQWIAGLGFFLIFFCIGGRLAIVKDNRNTLAWMGHHYRLDDAVLVTIQGPLVQKPKSFKAVGTVTSVLHHDTAIDVSGDVLLYFQKDSLPPDLHYGSTLLIHTPLQPIINSGNPGGFDYKRYCAFNNIYYQAFLQQGDYTILPGKQTTWFTGYLVATRQWVLEQLRKYIKDKDAVAVAEALLIGYRDDLDRELVQSYSNTGVVHIIAISGLHLGMIYGLLVWLFTPFQRKKWNRWVQPVVIITVLWLFTFLAGAVPSISRSAVMFTCIALGELINRKTSIYNTLAASALLLLLYDPFYLWDVGFQLSFAAVISIVAFSRHINNWCYFRNKLLKGLWNLTAVTMAAQLLTLPLILYHFHQFPNLFLFTNLLIVPLSGIILFAEIILLLSVLVPAVGAFIGNITGWLIHLMNTIIERADRIPFSLTDAIQISIPQSILLYGIIAFGCTWLLKKQKALLFAALACLLAFVSIRSRELVLTQQQQQLIVYNVPRNTAIDVIEGRHYRFIGDSIMREDGFLRNFHLKPSRILHRMAEGTTPSVLVQQGWIQSARHGVMIIDRPLPPADNILPLHADAVILTKNARNSIKRVKEWFNTGIVVFDAANSPWKIQGWKKECDSLHLRFHSIPDQGAFVMDL